MPSNENSLFTEESVVDLSYENNNSGVTNDNEENITELQEDWGEEFNNVVNILCGLHLNQYVEMFVHQGINLDIFLSLSEEDLCHIGMTNSIHRTELLKGITELKETRVEKSSEVSPTCLGEEEVVTILNNSVKHLTVIHASLAHTRINLRNSDVHNSLFTHTVSSAELLTRITSEAITQAQLVCNQSNALLTKNPRKTQKSFKTGWKFNVIVISSLGVMCALMVCLKKTVIK